MNQRARTLTVGGVPEHFNLPWHEALRDTPSAANWVDVHGGTGDMCRALDSGELDVAVLLTEGIVKHIHSGSDARIVGTYTASSLCWGVHVAPDGPADEAALNGATYAVSRYGSGSHLMALLDAAERGWNAPAFEVVGSMAGGANALARGTSDAFMWEKTMSLPRVHAGEWRRVSEFRGPWPAFVIAASPHALDDVARWLPGLLNSVRARAEEIMADTAAASPRIAEAYGLRVDDVSAWLDDTEWSCDTAVSGSMIERVLGALSEARILDGPRPAEAFVAAPAELVP